MGKKVAVINDLSGFGRCSLTAAISVLSAMGVQACPLPTAVLSAQTGYEDYHCVSLTEEMEQFRRSWEKMEARFDGIYTGFAADEEQIGHMIHIAETFHKKKAFLLVDPIMGDHGYKFDIFSIEFCRKMRELAKMADIVTPNLTELCILTDTDYRMIEKYDGRKTSSYGDQAAGGKPEERWTKNCCSDRDSVFVTMKTGSEDGKSGSDGEKRHILQHSRM